MLIPVTLQVESGWTISKLSATLSWFEVRFTSFRVFQVVRTCEELFSRPLSHCSRLRVLLQQVIVEGNDVSHGVESYLHLEALNVLTGLIIRRSVYVRVQMIFSKPGYTLNY